MSDFSDDDDDEILQAILAEPHNENDMKGKLYAAEGEVAILRAQLEQVQRERFEEVSKVRDTYNQFKKNADDQVITLKHAVQKLEDEKKFLNNELKSHTYTKKRKITSTIDVSNSNITTDDETWQTRVRQQQSIQRIIKVQNDSSLFADQIWNHCIIGSKRTTLSYLSKISVDFYEDIKDLKIKRRIPISSSISEYIMLKKTLRLDQLINEFCISLICLVEILLERKAIVSIPFLLSLIHCSISFRPAAITKSLIEELLIKLNGITVKFSFLLNSNLNEEDYINYHDVPHQIMLLEKFIFISCLDIMEKLVTYTSLYDSRYIEKIWQNKYISLELFSKCLSENSERFKTSSQINVLYNFVEMLTSSITEDTFAFNNHKSLCTDNIIIESLLKIFLIDIPIKDDFMFYGLNRIIGNNIDFLKINATVPEAKDIVNNFIILIPQPIPFELLNENKDNQIIQNELYVKHEFHSLNLRIKVADLLQSLIITKQVVEFLQTKEYVKSLIRIIGFEQVNIMKSPRVKHVSLRIDIISKILKILNYISQDVQDLSELVYPETMYELFVVLSRIAFGSDSLSIDAHNLLTKIRTRGYLHQTIFNGWSELKAREINHLDFSTNTNDLHTRKLLADIESDYPNGLEIPYESETVELARELLTIFATHGEADNLYFNMNYEVHEAKNEEFDEMELVE
ncbi:DNA damage checkpoint protein [Scheffersomyces amazonensis]|uniref:DNA damage checkpoint protein n=1 Tax=Scheffersomyces amazonensis TaxID=1078765 RepID=UPI00315DE669